MYTAELQTYRTEFQTCMKYTICKRTPSSTHCLRFHGLTDVEMLHNKIQLGLHLIQSLERLLRPLNLSRVTTSALSRLELFHQLLHLGMLTTTSGADFAKARSHGYTAAARRLLDASFSPYGRFDSDFPHRFTSILVTSVAHWCISAKTYSVLA